jgi:hypothetical protein
LAVGGVEFTGCPKGDDSWLFDAKSMHIDRSTGLGQAEDVLVRFKGLSSLHSPMSRVSTAITCGLMQRFG